MIRLTFGGTRGLLVPPHVEAHGHFVQPLAKLPGGVLLKLHPGVPELDVRVETVRLRVPTDGGLEVSQLVWAGVEQALELVRPRLPFRLHRARGDPDLMALAPSQRGDAEVAPASPERRDTESSKVELR